jgi:gamma-tubulin complex component 2
MLCFVQQLLYFCTSEVIEPNWVAFMSRLSQSEDSQETGGVEAGAGTSGQNAGAAPGASAASAGSGAGTSGIKRTVDELMQDHVDFLATCLKECMLTNSKLLRVSHLFACNTHLSFR